MCLTTREQISISSMLEERSFCAVVVCDGKLFVIGGLNRKSRLTNTVEK